MATLTITRKLNDLVNNGWGQQELDDFDSRRVVRDFLKEGVVYGSDKDEQGGKWTAEKIGIIINDGNDVIFVEAAASSGKTALIIDKIKKEVDEWEVVT